MFSWNYDPPFFYYCFRYIDHLIFATFLLNYSLTCCMVFVLEIIVQHYKILSFPPLLFDMIYARNVIYSPIVNVRSVLWNYIRIGIIFITNRCDKNRRITLSETITQKIINVWDLSRLYFFFLYIFKL